MKCKFCDAEVYEYQTMCLNCGKKLTEDKIVVEEEEEVTKKTVKKIAKDKKIIAIVLAIAFGYLGAHCFYLGEKKKGITRIITTFIPPIGVILCILDIVKIAKGTYVCDENAFI